MKYKDIKYKLQEKGFELKYVQTSGNLEMLHFEHPNIEGIINVDFKYDEPIPQDILDGREFNYNDDNETWLLDFPILSIRFDIDVSISFVSSYVICTSGEDNRNEIQLFGNDLNLFEKVLNIVTDPLANINFQQEYNKEFNSFCEWLKPFVHILNKHKLIPCVAPTGGNDYTLYRSLVFYFYKHTTRNSVNFHFNVLNWERDITINIEPGLLKDSGEVGPNVSLENFEKELVRQLDIAEKYYNKIND